MISFDLRCAAGHVFEAWFRSGADFDAQQGAHAIPCPTCGDTRVTKGVMAPAVAVKGNRRPAPAMAQGPQPMVSGGPAVPPAVADMLAAVAQAQAEALPRSRWVGSDFATEARALHARQAGGAAADGAADGAGDAGSETGGSDAIIHGQATPQEAQALRDEGIAVMPLLVPVIPPDLRN